MENGAPSNEMEGMQAAGGPGLEDQILELLRTHTNNPGQAFTILQQLSVFLWARYDIDWKNNGDNAVTGTPEERYLDYMKELIKHFLAVKAQQP